MLQPVEIEVARCNCFEKAKARNSLDRPSVVKTKIKLEHPHSTAGFYLAM
jgi:hypothetical protein